MKFIGFLAICGAIAFGVFGFSPEYLPAGVGFSRCPATASFKHSFFGHHATLVVVNPTSQVLHHLTVTCQDARGHQARKFIYDELAPGKSVEIGSDEGWSFDSDQSADVSAGGYLAQNIPLDK